MIKQMVLKRENVLRYLGYQGQTIDEKLSALIGECEALTVEQIIPRTLYREFPILFGDSGVTVCGTALTLPGKGILAHLSGCTACVLFAATVGFDIERTIQFYSPRDLTKSVIIDAVATTAIEAVADEAERSIREEAAGRGLTLGWRYSPGYGDLPISLQSEILGILNTSRQIGLSCLESGILTPRKSITAVMGLSSSGGGVKPGCGACNMKEHCQYRKDGSASGTTQAD